MTERAEDSKVRWSRSQRLRLSSVGREAGISYREEIVASRSEGGRASFDAARAAWAARLSLGSYDGISLMEFEQGPRTVEEIVAALDGYGPNRADVRTLLERLVRVGMLELVEPPPPPPSRGWR